MSSIGRGKSLQELLSNRRGSEDASSAASTISSISKEEKKPRQLTTETTVLSRKVEGIAEGFYETDEENEEEIELPSASHGGFGSEAFDNPFGTLALQQSGNFNLDQIKSVEEEEMPSSSYSVLPGDSDVMKMLAAEKLDNEDNRSGRQDEVIELYSAIAFLKKENKELTKELELTRKSKDAKLIDAQAKAEQTIQKLRAELRDANQRELQREHDNIEVPTLRQANEDLTRDLTIVTVELDTLKKTLERRQDDQTSLRTDLATSKAETNKLRMEIARIKSDFEKASRENEELKISLQSVQVEVSSGGKERDELLRNQHQELRKSEDQIISLKNEVFEKGQVASRLTTELASAERSIQSLAAERDLFKQRASMLEIAERDLSQLRYRISSLENENRDLVSEVGYLRNQQQMASSMRMAQPPPPLYNHPPPDVYSHNAHLAHSLHSVSVPPPLPVSSAVGPSYSSRYATSDSVNTVDSSGSSNYKPTQSNSNLNNFSTNNVPKSAPKSLSTTLEERGGPRNDSTSLASLLQGRKQASGGDIRTQQISSDDRNDRRKSFLPAQTQPFATERTAAELMVEFERLERDLTRVMAEKTSLQEEGERLLSRGLKTLRDRTRSQQVEARLEEIGREIASLRLKLTNKPA